MPTLNRRAAGRRRAWGRGPIILKFDSLERREMLTVAPPAADLAGSSLVTTHAADWGNSIDVRGNIVNQGGTVVTTPFDVALYASPSTAIGRYAVPIGDVTIPAGLLPGQTVPFDTTVKLPATPIPGVSKTGIVYVDMKIDPTQSVPESNRRTNSGLGIPYESSYIAITANQPSNLQGSTLAVSTPTTTWGSTISVTAQVRNAGAGSSPPTRAVLMLTPTGTAPNWPNDVAIGSLNIPPVPAYQTVNVVQQVTLPATVPTLLNSDGNTAYTLSMIQDADYVTNAAYPHLPSAGLGYDLVNMTISPSATAPATTPSLPDLAASSVLLSADSLSWGETFQVTTTLQNLGAGDAGPFTVRFLLIGQNGQVNQGIFLADAHIPGLAAGYDQPLVQTLQLPTRVPAGMNLNSVGYAKIAVLVNAENSVNETLISNNLGESAPVVVRLPGTNGTSVVPTTAGAGALPSLKAQPAPKTKPHPKLAEARAKRAASQPLKKLHRKPVKKEPALVRQIIGLPTTAKNLIKKYI
jgi:CARDB